MTMGKIIYCSDLVLRIDESEDVTNITEWLMESTEYRPLNPEGCVVRQEMTTMGKLTVILVVWIALIVLTTFYCYFCEQRLFPSQKAKRLAESQFAQTDEGGKEEDSKNGFGHLIENMAAALPKPKLRSRKEVN